jgi:CHAT domain-containing protein
MKHVKKPICIVLFLCSVVMACNRENTVAGDWREKRPRTGEDRVAPLDPVELLRTLETAKGADRALAQERLGLIREAIHSWDEVAREGSDRSGNAAGHRKRLQQLPDPLGEWNPRHLKSALDRRDAVALTKITRAFPADAAGLFENSDLRDRERARRFATALAEAGEHYPMAVVEAMERTSDTKALEQGLAAMKRGDYRRAATLLERAGNPLHLAARYYATLLPSGPISLLDTTLPHLKPEYRELASRIYAWRANLVEFEDGYLAAHADYDRALGFAKGEPTVTARILGRRSWNYCFIGDAEAAFRDAHRAVSLLPHVADTNARNTAYAAAAMAARQLGHPLIALHYQNAAVQDIQRAVIAAASPIDLAYAKRELVGALRARAEIHVGLGRNTDAEGDLAEAADLAEAVEQPEYRDLFRMRIREVRGQTLLETHPAAAAAAFGEAIDLAKGQDSTYRAMLHFQRAAAWRNAGDGQADDDIATAMTILRDEVRSALLANPVVASQPLGDPYFSRFREMYQELIESRIDVNDTEGAFVAAELARAFEPMQILLQSRSAPPGFRPIETLADVRQALANVPEDTVILQYLVLPARTWTWVVTREEIQLVPQSTTKKQVERWAADAVAAVAAGQSEAFKKAMRAAYGELFRAPLQEVHPSKTRIVIVPDESMHGLPFNGLVGTDDEGYLIERASIATAGSTSLYLYALARDRQFSKDGNPPVLLIGDPAFISPKFPRLPDAKQEVEELARHYRGAEVLTDIRATVDRFLTGARNAGIIHFAGHGLASPQNPWQSRLLFAPDGEQSGELSAERLMKELPTLERTRLVVLGACSTAGGGPVGPQGLAPLVRPLIGARVPAIVGALWDVRDTSAKQLLVSFHCHYRHGDDVAVALRNAQLERLRKHDPRVTPMQWAAFQVIGYAASPYPHTSASADTEHVCMRQGRDVVEASSGASRGAF